MSLQILTFATLFLQGTLAGVFVGSAMMEHAARNMDAPGWISYNQAKDDVYGPVMPVFFGITMLTSITNLAFGSAHTLQAMAALALLVAGVITVRIHLPLNKEFGTWSAQEHPTNWAQQKGRWRNWNMVRVVCALVAFMLAIVAGS